MAAKPELKLARVNELEVGDPPHVSPEYTLWVTVPVEQKNKTV